MMIMYVDMDGVIADFEGEKAKWNGSYNKFFKHMIDSHGFAKLDRLPSERLITRLRQMQSQGVKIKILSSYGRPENLSVRDDKAKWLQGFPFTFDEHIFVPGKAHKREYANENSLLIDDTASNVFDFIDGGGLAILHKSEDETIAYLDKIFGV